MSDDFATRVNKALRDIRGVTVGGEPDRQKNSMKVSDWIRAESAARNGSVPTHEVVQNNGDEEEE